MRFSVPETLLQQGVKDGVFPSAAAGVLRGPRVEWIGAVGATRETLFDLASLTKVLATTGIAARLCERKEISLDDGVTERLGDLPWQADFNGITVRDLLAHRAGFEGWVDFSKEPREKILTAIASRPPVYPPRSSTLYSDLGFIVLGALLEKVSVRSLERLVEEEIRNPIGCATLLSHPKRHGIPLSRIAATEDVASRGGVIHGEVHDGNTFALGGLAGHAGLFGTVEDCLKVGGAWRDSILRTSRFLGVETAREFAAPVPAGKGPRRALGWDLPTPLASAAGRKASKRTIGHLGFTGTSIWIDLERDAVAVLLSNRVHPTARNEKIKRFRPDFHDAVWEALDS